MAQIHLDKFGRKCVKGQVVIHLEVLLDDQETEAMSDETAELMLQEEVNRLAISLGVDLLINTKAELL